MRFLSWHRRAVIWRRRLVTAVALGAYVVTTIGLPLPTLVDKHSDRPFPCQHHACGCLTAEQCWDHCCCYSPSQKLAWARRHQVEPPRQLLAAVAAEAHEHEHLAALAAANGSGGCCAHREARAIADAREHACDEHAKASCREPNARAARLTFVVGIMARQCRGLADFWCQSGAVLPVSPAVGWHFQWDVVEWLASDTPQLDSLDLAPPIPPPRV
jgi:hypothetical protein